MRGLRIAALLLAAWAGAVPAALETPRLRRLGVDDGLPSSGVHAIAQDRAGYLWLATRDGLARFDGVDFRVWRYTPGDASALPGNNIQALHVDASDRVWVAIEGHGVSWLGPERRGFSHLRRELGAALGSDEIWAIASTADGAVWLGSFGGGLHRLAADGAITRFVHQPDDARSLPADNVLALAVAADGGLWVGTTAGLARWTGHDFEAVAAGRLSSPVVFSLSADADGSLWIGTAQGLDRRGPAGDIAPVPWRAQLSDRGVTAVLRDRDGTRWIATRSGLDRERDGRVHPVQGGPSFLAAFEDHEGGLWFASRGHGLYRLTAGWRQFGALERRLGDPQGTLGNDAVQALAPAGGNRIWVVGSGHALDRVDLDALTVERVLSGPSAFPDRRLWSVLQRRDGSVWVGHHLGLTRFDPSGDRPLRHYLAGSEADAALPGPVTLLCETADGLLWSASLGYGLQARDAEGRVRHSLPADGGAGMAWAGPEQLIPGPDGGLWLAGASGLLRWEAEAQALRPVAGAPEGRIHGVLFLPPDRLWLSRPGLLEAWRWQDERLELLQRYGSDDGIPAVEAGGLAADRSGVLWLSTPRGLLRFDPLARQARLFTSRDGLHSQEFVDRPPLLAGNGIGVAATAAGLALFDPARLRAQAMLPRLSLDALSLRRDEDEVALPTDAARIVLQPADRDLRVAARLLSFADPRGHRYRFRLDGYDPDWVENGARNERVFSRLDPGSYRLQVTAAAAGGPWSLPHELEVQVLPPWWRHPAAGLVAGLLALLLLAAAASLYRARLRQRHARQLGEQRRHLAEQSSEAKSRFLATLGHEIRTPMTGVLGMAELLLGSALPEAAHAKVLQIQRAGQHLLRLLNDALDLARIEAGKLELVAVPFDLHALLDEAAALLRPLAEAKGLRFSLQRGPDTPRALLGDAARVRQILLNLGNNAIKFTERGEVALRTSALAGDGVLIEVADSGPGLSAEQQARLFRRFEQADGAQTAARYGGSGLGLAICQELAGAMGGRIDVVSAPGEGASFRVALPLPRLRPEQLPAESPAPAPPTATERLSILLVEDDPLLAEVLSGLLQGLGHRVTHAPQALAALSALAAETPALALLDLDLPGMDGLQLARLIRSQGRELPLIALTARSDPEAEPQAFAAGMTAFLRKPVTGAMLAATIAAALSPRSE